MINENRLIELLEDEILRIDTESTPGCGNLYGRDASVMKNTLNFVIDLINEQPKVGEWIPVEERLPEEKECLKISQEIAETMCFQSYDHGQSWRITDISIVEQEERYKVGTIVRVSFRIRDSY